MMSSRRSTSELVACGIDGFGEEDSASRRDIVASMMDSMRAMGTGALGILLMGCAGVLGIELDGAR